MTLILAGTIRIAPERLADLRPHLRAQVENTRAEPGCLDFHRATAHMAAWRAACAELGVYGRDLSSFDVSDYRKI